MMLNKAYCLLTGCLLTILLAGNSCGRKEERILPERMKITESVYAAVTIQPDSLYQVYAAVSGLLDAILVAEGEQVEQGTPLMQIINSTPKLQAENAQLDLQLAREYYSGNSAVLKSLRDEIDAAELNFRNDSINYFRQKKLWEEQIGSKVEFERRKLAYELSGNQLAVLRNSYARTGKELANKVRQAENRLKTATLNTKDFTVTSKINGTVYALYKKQGESVTGMEPLASVGSTHDFLVEMLVDEVDIVKLRLAQRALITLDAYKDQVFEATVSKIYPRKDERSQTFKVEARFNHPPGVLYPGLAGEGNIIVNEKENALTIPKDYLMEGNRVQTDTGTVTLQLGLQNLEFVEVLSGLDETTQIIKPGE